MRLPWIEFEIRQSVCPQIHNTGGFSTYDLLVYRYLAVDIGWLIQIAFIFVRSTALVMMAHVCSSSPGQFKHICKRAISIVRLTT
jgi:hypothetical protein